MRASGERGRFLKCVVLSRLPYTLQPPVRRSVRRGALTNACARAHHLASTMERRRLPSQPGLTAATQASGAVVDGAQQYGAQRQYYCYGRAGGGTATVVRAPRVGAATVVRALTEHPPGSCCGGPGQYPMSHERLASPPASLGPRATAPRAPPHAWPYPNSPVRKLVGQRKQGAAGAAGAAGAVGALKSKAAPPSPQRMMPVPNVVRPARDALGTDGGVRGALKLTRTPLRTRSLPSSPHLGAAMTAAKLSTELTVSELTISLGTLESPIASPHAASATPGQQGTKLSLSTPRRVKRVSFGELCLEQRRAMGTVASGARQVAPDDQMAPDGGEMVSRRECHQIPHASPAPKSRSPNPASPLPRRSRAALAEPAVSPLSRLAPPSAAACATPVHGEAPGGGDRMGDRPHSVPMAASPQVLVTSWRDGELVAVWQTASSAAAAAPQLSAPPKPPPAAQPAAALPQAAAQQVLLTPQALRTPSEKPMSLGSDPAAQAQTSQLTSACRTLHALSRALLHSPVLSRRAATEQPPRDPTYA